MELQKLPWMAQRAPHPKVHLAAYVARQALEDPSGNTPKMGVWHFLPTLSCDQLLSMGQSLVAKLFAHRLNDR